MGLFTCMFLLGTFLNATHLFTKAEIKNNAVKKFISLTGYCESPSGDHGKESSDNRDFVTINSFDLANLSAIT